MAPGAVMAAVEELSVDEAREVLLRAGLEEASTKGRGGLCTVMGVATFASLGGMLFGLDIGYIAGVKSMKSFERDVLGGLPITKGQDSCITMVFGLGAALSAFPPIISAAVDRLGRKGSVICGGVVFCAGALMQGVATNMPVMMIGRLIAGLSVGLLSANVPVYQSEIAPPTHRGMLVSVYQLALTIGIMVAFVMALALENVSEPIGGWRWVILAQIIPGAALILGGLAMGESPRWLVQKGRTREALKTLVAVRGPEDDVRMELAEICNENEREQERGDPSWGEFLSGYSLRLLSIGVVLQLLQQACGMNVYMYDGPKIFEAMFRSSHAGRLFTAVSGAVNVCSTFPAIFFIDKAGRMVLLKFSALGMAICSAVLAIVGSVCFPEHACQHNEGEAAAACVNTTFPNATLVNASHLVHNFTAAAAGLPPPPCGDWAKWTATLAICLFIFNFGYGWGPVVWTYCAEMFPLKYRTKAVGATTDANWVGNIFIAFAPPLLLGTIGFSTFWIFVGINLLGFYIACKLPETKDKSLEEVQRTFQLWLGEGEEEETSSEESSGSEDDSN